MIKKVAKRKISTGKKRFQKCLSIFFKHWWEKFCYILEKPMRIKEGYDCLTAEIKELETMK